MNIAERLMEAASHHGPVIVSVDGRDVIDCRPAAFATSIRCSPAKS